MSCLSRKETQPFEGGEETELNWKRGLHDKKDFFVGYDSEIFLLAWGAS